MTQYKKVWKENIPQTTLMLEGEEFDEHPHPLATRRVIRFKERQERIPTGSTMASRLLEEYGRKNYMLSFLLERDQETICRRRGFTTPYQTEELETKKIMSEYNHQFSALHNQGNIPPDMLLDIYMGGLMHEILHTVQLLDPRH
ncbi:hypothetical protein L1887_11007 [Cichorium endivia]|nr:hypothetical protein L1887_11007 [Cichorium endivia]